MSKNFVYLSVVAAIMAVIYVVNFTNWFRTPPIVVIAQARPGLKPMRGPNNENLYPVTIQFRDACRITSLKVVAESELAKGKNAQPLWDLIPTHKSSPPTKAAYYGLPIRGMKASKPRARPQPLQPGTTYVVLVESGKSKGQARFTTGEVRAQAQR